MRGVPNNFATGSNDNHKINTLSENAVPAAPLPDLKRVFQTWLLSRSDYSTFQKNNQPYPVFIVAAEGGGIYAAMHSALVLSRIYDLCPLAAQHIFAISGVSGGSLGAAVYSSLVRAGNPEESSYSTDAIEACRLHGRAKESLDTIGASLLYPSGLEFKARSILSNDFLTPLVRAFLFVDFFQNFLPYPIGPLDRARALEESFATAWRASGSTDPGAFDRDFREAWDPREKSPAPALVLNTTNVSTGERVVIAPFRIDSRAGLGSMWRVAQFDTLRLRLIKIAARVVEMKTMIRVHLPTSCPVQDILRFALGRIPRLVT